MRSIDVDNAGGYKVGTDGFSWYVVAPDGKPVTHSAYGRQSEAETAARCAGDPEYRRYMMARSAGYSDFKHGRGYTPYGRENWGYADGWNAAADGLDF